VFTYVPTHPLTPPRARPNAGCAAGTASAAVGADDISTCVQCPKDTYSTGSSSACTPCPLGSTSPAGSTGEEACHFSMAFAYKLTREEYQIAAEKLKNAIGPFKSARDAMTNAISSYTESMYEAGGGKGGSTGMSNKKGASGATGQATTSTSETQKAPGAPGAPGQKWWEVYKAQKKPTASLSGGAPAGPPGESSRGRDGSKEQASSRGRDGGHEWKVSDPVIKKDVDDAKTKEALQQKLYKDAAKEREEQKKEQAKEVAAERKELLEEALKRIAAKEAKKEEEEKLAKHLKELAEERRQQALERYQEQQKEDAVRTAEVAKRIAAEEQARAKQAKAKLANALLLKVKAQAEEQLKQAAMRDLYKDDHGRSSSPLFEHANVHKAGCGGEDGDGSLDEECEEEPAGDGKRPIIDSSNELSWATNLLAKSSATL